MILRYPNKKSEKTILSEPTPKKITPIGPNNNSPNKLIKGDNSSVLKLLGTDYGLTKKIDLVYIDPPFSTNTIFRASDDRAATISSSKEDKIAYADDLKGAEFIEFLRERLILIRELMSDSASIYLHIDYKIGHYIKVMMDELFGINNFRNDISRVKCNPKNFNRKAYSNIKDMVLFYTKSKNYVWNEPLEKMAEENVARLFNKIDKNGRRYTTNPLHAPGQTMNGRSGQEWKGMLPPKGRHWRYSPEILDQLDKQGLIERSKNGVPRKIIYADDYGLKRIQDIWEFKDSQTPSYPTEKPAGLLDLIIRTSSNRDQIVLDSFCGSGTTLCAAALQERYWIGIDQSDIAIKATKKKLSKHEPSLFKNYFTYTYFEEA